MRNNLIDDDLQAQPVRLGHQGVEIGKCAEHRIDIAIIGNVITHIGHGRGEEGREPDGIDTERGDIGQTFRHPGKIAISVTGRILKRARINLIDHRSLPPVRLRLGFVDRGMGCRHERSPDEGWSENIKQLSLRKPELRKCPKSPRSGLVRHLLSS
ncbi:hypothetical protein D3C78_1321320 [compost metagenome]